MRNHKYKGRKSSMNVLLAFCVHKYQCPYLNTDSCSVWHDKLQHVAQSHAHLIVLVTAERIFSKQRFTMIISKSYFKNRFGGGICRGYMAYRNLNMIRMRR